jgi:bzd-type benzoyl-CoA reductase N subunit
MLSKLVESARLPLADWPARYPGRQAMGTLCSYVPEEIIHAAGLTPVRLRGNAAPLRCVDTHLQSFTCALCRSTLDQALGGGLEFLVGTVLAHSCDAMQALADLWKMNVTGTHFVDTVMQPTNLSSPAARPYLVAELDRFRARLAGLVNRPISDDSLRASIALYDETRRLVQSLQNLRDRLGAAEFLAVLDAAQSMPREEYNPLLAGVLKDLKDAPPQTDGPRLFLVGAVLDEPRVLDLIEELAARVVGDDLCCGSRHFNDQVGDGEPVGALADYFLRRPPCPSKYHATHEPGETLVRRVRQAGADGLVFVLEKFCEPHAFEQALVLPDLDRARIPYLVLELEQTSNLEAMRTRVQAFVEIL